MKEGNARVLGIDVGGTKIAAGVVHFPQGTISSQRTIATRAARGGEAVWNDLVQLARELASPSPPAAIGVGLCELVSADGQILSANSVDWRSLPDRSRLERIAPVTFEADVRAAARAEALFGAGRAFRIFLYITIGTGISSCLMINDQPFTGARGATGTMASSPLAWACQSCGFVGELTLEEIASGPALVKRYNDRSGAAVASGEEVLAAATAGDRRAVEVVRSAGHALGVITGWLINALDPEAVIFGGGLGVAPGLYWESVQSSTRQYIWSDVHRDLPLLQASTGRDAGVIGAAAAAWMKWQ